MNTIEVVITIILIFVSVGCFVVSCFQFNEKGFLLNNAYLYATKEQRDKMNKKPHYRQSAIIFLILGLIFLVNALKIIIKSNWLAIIVIGLVIISILYAIVSSINIEKNNK